MVLVTETDEEISNFNENTVPKSTKKVKKTGLKLFRSKNCVVERCLTLFGVNTVLFESL